MLSKEKKTGQSVLVNTSAKLNNSDIYGSMENSSTLISKPNFKVKRYPKNREGSKEQAKIETSLNKSKFDLPREENISMVSKDLMLPVTTQRINPEKNSKADDELDNLNLSSSMGVKKSRKKRVED